MVAQVAAHLADLVLEELAQRLHQVHLEVVGEAPHVVVALDHGGVAAVGRHGLDDVRVEGALAQEVRVAEALGLVAEDLDELVADDLALALGVRDAGELAHEAVRGVDGGEVQADVVPEGLLHHLALAFAEQPVVHKDAVQPVADGAVHEHGGDRAVHIR